MNVDELKSNLQDLFNDQKLAVLSSDKQNQPYPSLIAFTFTEDLKNFLFATMRNSNKYNNMMNNPKVSLLIDNRENQSSDFSKAMAVSVFGKAVEIKEDENPYMNLYLNRHPYLEDFVRSSDCALLRIKVEKYLVVSQFQNVQEIMI